MSNKATAELASQILGWYSTPVGVAPVVSSLATGGDTYPVAMAPNHQCNRNQDGYAGSDGWRRAA